jgi:hypothetical protein
MTLLNKRLKLNTWYVLPLLIVLSLFLPASAYAAETNSPPSVVIKDIKIVNGDTTITGTVSDDHTNPEEITMELVASNETPVTITPSVDGTWSITKNFTQKLNRYDLVATDKPLVEGEMPQITTIPVQRPYITSIKTKVLKFQYKTIEEEVRDETLDVDLMQNDDVTRVSIKPTTILVDLSDEVSTSMSNPIAVYDRNFSKTTIDDFDFVTNTQIMLTLNNLLPGKTYYLMFNPSLIAAKYYDDAGRLSDVNENDFYPFIKKFTTVSEAVKSHDPDKDTAINEYTAEVVDQPHGFYSGNVNTCDNCHSTHVSENINLDKPIPAYKEKAKENSYCMACHDGTAAAPLRENNAANNNEIVSRHDAVENPEHPSSAGSCTTCHNPHLTWSEQNPNLLKDHNVYTNNGISRDSLDETCQSCHEGDSISGPEDYHQNSTYEVFSYKKSTTANGQLGNYSLCLRCHNGGKASNIKQYYEKYNEDELKDEVTITGHTITAINGSKLRGNIPCAECHETHSSTNLKLLKSKLGHENQEEFSYPSGSWVDNERIFCMKCHNGKTSIYGVTATLLLDPLKSPGHSTMELCSKCHGTGKTDKEKALSAAHGPITVKQQIQVESTQPQEVPTQSTITPDPSTPDPSTTTPDPSTTTNESPASEPDAETQMLETETPSTETPTETTETGVITDQSPH